MRTLKTAILISLLSISFNSFADLKTGLIAYYPFNGNANDESGNNHNGIINGATLTRDSLGRPDSAYNFNGYNSYISINDALDLRLSNKITSISLFIKSLSDNQLAAVIRKGISCNIPGWSMDSYTPSVNPFIFLAWNDLRSSWAWNVSNKENITQGQWHHIVMVSDGKVATIYLDGEFINSSSVDSSVNIDTNSPMFIGAAPPGACGSVHAFYNGDIDEVRIYNRALAADEVTALYQQGVIPKLATPTGLEIPSQSPLTLKWNAVPNATSYRIVISKDRYFEGLTEKQNKSICDASCVTFKVPINSSASTYSYTPTLDDLNYFTFLQTGINYIGIRAGSNHAEYSNWGIWSFSPETGVISTPINNTGILNPYPIDGDRKLLTADEAVYVLESVNFPQFSYAVKNKQFDVKKLTPIDRSVLMNMLIAKSIAMNSELFEGTVSEAFKNKSLEHYKQWNNTFDIALLNIDNANNIDVFTYAELFSATAFNLADGISDAITLGGMSTVKSIPKSLKKLIPRLGKQTNLYRKAVKLKNVFESKEFKLLELLVTNSWILTNTAMDMISQDKALEEQLKNIGIFSANLVIDGVIENQDMSRLKGLVDGKLYQATIEFLAEVITTDAELSQTPDQLLKEILKAILSVVPIVNPIMEEYQITQDILSRQKPEEVVAWQEYINLQKIYRKETDALNEEIRLAKLQMTLKAAEQRFSNMNDVHF